MTNNVSYTIAMNIYRALGGQQSGFESVEDVYAAVDEIYSAGGGRIVVEPIKKKVSTGGVYTYNDENVTGYKPVEFEVDIKEGYDLSGLGYSDELINAIIEADKDEIIKGVTFKESWNPDSTNGPYVYSNYPNNKYIPQVDFSNTTSFSYYFDQKVLPNITTAATSLKQSYSGTMKDLIAIGGLNAPNCTTLGYEAGSNYYFFTKCSRLTYIGDLYLPLVTTANSMFQDMTALKKIKSLTLSSDITSTKYMFDGCSSLKEVPLFDTSNVTDMSNMFSRCYKLQELPLFDTSNVTNMYYTFDRCESLKELPLFDTSNVTNMYYTFSGCKFERYPLFDCGNVSNFKPFYTSASRLSHVKYVGGFKDLGKKESLTIADDIHYLTGLDHESLMNIINNLYDRAAAGYSMCKINFYRDLKKLLTNDEIAIATNKGWTVNWS